MSGALAGVAALGLAYRGLTAEARAARTDQERQLNVLREMGAKGLGTGLAGTIAAGGATVGRLETQLRGLMATRAGYLTSPDEDVAIQRARLGQLQDQINEIANQLGIARGG